MRAARSIPWTAGLSLLASALLVVGCASSSQSRYLSHLQGKTSQGSGGSRDVALAFGLDEFRDDGAALVNAGAVDAEPEAQVVAVDPSGSFDSSSPR
jgi:hypothetical protein